MSKTNTWEDGLLQLLLQNVDFTGVGDAGGLRGSVAGGSLYLSLHTADPGEAGAQNTNETNYTSYARLAIVRSASNFAVSGGVGSNVNEVSWPVKTGGTAVLTHWGIGTASAGAGKLLYKGALPGTITLADNERVTVQAGQMTITET